MGCVQTRKQTDEEHVEELEKQLKFGEYTIAQIKDSFFQITGEESFKKSQVEKAVEHLGINYSTEEKQVFDRFIKSFFAYEDENIEYFEAILTLTAIFLLSKSTSEEKAAALFDLYDSDDSNSLSSLEAESAFDRILNVVFLYSENLLENSDSVIEMHRNIMQDKKDKLLAHTSKFFYGGLDQDAELSRREYLAKMAQSFKEPDFVDYTDPKSIRAKLMEFLLKGSLNQIQLQQEYGVRQSIRAKSAFMENMSEATNDNSPATSSIGISRSPSTNESKQKNI